MRDLTTQAEVEPVRPERLSLVGVVVSRNSKLDHFPYLGPYFHVQAKLQPQSWSAAKYKVDYSVRQRDLQSVLL